MNPNLRIMHGPLVSLLAGGYNSLLFSGTCDSLTICNLFRYPLTALQAFGIALSSFDCKIACE